MVLDISCPQSRNEFVQQFMSDVGRCNILVNNAGVANLHRFDRTSDAELDRTLVVNLVGVMKFTRDLMPAMKGVNEAHIVNIASLWGKIGTAYNSSYAAS